MTTGLEQLTLNKVLRRFTVSVNEALWLSPPPVPVTLTEYIPAGVEGVVEIVSAGEPGGVCVHVGIIMQPPLPPLNIGVAPFGRPLTLSVTGCAVPWIRPRLIMLEPEEPRSKFMFDEGLTEKSKHGFPIIPTWSTNWLE
jgi:hypothetical protein